MPYDLETKDGIVIRNVPDDAPEEELRARVAKIRAERDAVPQEPQEAPQKPEGIGAKALKGFGTGVSSIAGLAEMLATAGVSLGRPEEEGWGYKSRKALAEAEMIEFDLSVKRGEVVQLVEQTVAETARATTLQNAGMNPF